MLTSREQDTLSYIQRYLEDQGQAPLLSEIAQGLGIRSKGVVHRYVSRLTQLGYINSGNGRHRGISILHRGRDNGEDPNLDPTRRGVLPLLGKIAAGKPIEAVVGQDSIDMMEFFIGPDRFVLRVEGDSMQDAGILSGDMVVVRHTDTAKDNDIVVALVDSQDATLKYFHNHCDGTVSLRPANKTMSVRRYTADRIAIQGVVVAQMRSYQ